MSIRSRRFPTLLSLCGLVLLALTPNLAGAAGSPRIEPFSVTSQAPPKAVNVRVSHDQFAAHSEPFIAENPRNPNNLIAGSKFFSDPAHYLFKIGTYYSINGGKTWHDSGLLPGFADYHTTSDVSIAFAADGTAYVAVLACDGGGVCPGNGNRSGIFVSRSTDGGKSFSQPVPVFLDTTQATFSDKEWITIDRTNGPTAGTIYVAWNLDNVGTERDRNGPDDRFTIDQTPEQQDLGLVVSRSTDGGRTFSPPVLVSRFAPEFLIGATPAVSPDGHLDVVFASLDDSTGQTDGIELSTSSDGGQTFSAPRTIAQVNGLPNHLENGTFRNVSLPAFAVSPTDGSMVVAWADMRHGDADILAIRSLDGGQTWSKPIRVNDDPVGDGKDQFQPALAVARNGTYTCAWFDRRYDPANRLIDEEIAQSTDDGHSFGLNVRVTRKSWNPAIDAPEPEGKKKNTFIGDYQGLAVDNKTVHPLWNDTQNGKSQEIRTASMPVHLFFQR